MKDPTLEVLKDIRGELGGLRKDVQATNERLDGLERRQTETEIRLATEIVAVASAIRDLRDVLIEDRAVRARVDDHENRIQRLERAG